MFLFVIIGHYNGLELIIITKIQSNISFIIIKPQTNYYHYKIYECNMLLGSLTSYISKLLMCDQ